MHRHVAGPGVDDVGACDDGAVLRQADVGLVGEGVDAADGGVCADLEAAREQANKSRSSANAAQAVLDQLQQAKAHQDQRQAKEEEARTTFATLAAANAKGDYSGAHSAAVAYAALAEEVKNLKDNEYAAKERILARAV